MQARAGTEPRRSAATHLTRQAGRPATPSHAVEQSQWTGADSSSVAAENVSTTSGLSIRRSRTSLRTRTSSRQLDTPGVEFEPAQLGRRPERSAPPTPEELLEAHATLMETRRSAQTAGVKAGATRRIRKIEAALTDRGVEFQPAPLSRSRGSSATPSTPEQLLADRAAWIEAYQAAETAGQRQGASRRIRNIERKLDTPGVEFEPAQLGRRPQRSAPPTPEELLEAHATLMETRRSAQTAGVKAGATRRIRKIEAALTDRGVEFQPAPLSRSRGSSATPSTPEQLLADRAAWIKAYQAAETAGQRQGASRRIRNIERKLDARGVEFEPAQLGRRPQRSAPSTEER